MQHHKMADSNATKILDPTSKATPKVAKGPKQYENYEPWKSIGPEKFESSKWAVVDSGGVWRALTCVC